MTDLTVKRDKSIEVIISVTSNCNCKCKYCFENERRIKNITPEIEDRIMVLLKDLICNKDKYGYKELRVTFWGGEPMMNFGYVKRILDVTNSHEFIKYFMYTNGMLYDRFEELVGLSYFSKIKNKFSFQLSYDGEPQNRELRCDNRDILVKTAKLLIKNNVPFHFKATLGFEYMSKFDEMWKSYYDFGREIGKYITFAPTIDMFPSKTYETFQDWKDVLPKICKLEYDYKLTHGKYLLWWFNDQTKTNCGVNDTITIGVDGNIYICQNDFFLEDEYRRNKLVVSNIFEINSLIEAYKLNIDYSKKSDECENCMATFCNKCHIKTVDVENIEKDWNFCGSRDVVRCDYMKYLGKIMRMFNSIVAMYMPKKPSKSTLLEMEKTIYNLKCVINFKNGFNSSDYRMDRIISDNFDVKELFK